MIATALVAMLTAAQAYDLQIGVMQWTTYVPDGLLPPPLFRSSFIADPGYDRAVLLGVPQNPDGSSSNLQAWTWKNRRWYGLAVSPAIDARGGFVAAYFPPLDAIVVTVDGTATWQLQGDAWTELEDARLPGDVTVSPAALAYDPQTEHLVLLGGYNPSRTYEFDGASWVETNIGEDHPELVVSSPLLLDYDGSRLIFAAPASCSPVTWFRDSGRWVRGVADSGAPLQMLSGTVYDPSRGRSIVLDGVRCSGGNYEPGPSFDWNGSRWIHVFPVGEMRQGSINTSAIFDRDLGAVLTFGGPERDLPTSNAMRLYAFATPTEPIEAYSDEQFSITFVTLSGVVDGVRFTSDNLPSGATLDAETGELSLSTVGRSDETLAFDVQASVGALTAALHVQISVGGARPAPDDDAPSLYFQEGSGCAEIDVSAWACLGAALTLIRRRRHVAL
jgi:hypothetical protein